MIYTACDHGMIIKTVDYYCTCCNQYTRKVEISCKECSKKELL